MRTAALLSILATTLPAQQAPAPSTEKGSIEGVVVNQVTNAPIKKAQVNIAGTQAVTDASGHFFADQLAAGVYEVSAWHPNFPQSTRPSPAAHVRVTLEPGEHRKDISISLIPSVAVTGSVLDDEGNQLPGCFVQVMRFTYQAGKKELRPMGGSPVDDRGEYRIANLAAGSFYLMALCRHQVAAARPFAPKDAILDLPEETYADQYYPGSSDVSGATKLTPPPGAELRDLDFRMRKIRAVSIRGKVTRPGVEVSNQFMQVMIIPKNRSERSSVRPGQVKPSGEFELHGVLPGSYWLTANNYDPGSPSFGRIDLDVGDSPIAEIVLPLSSAVTVSGTVETEASPPGTAPLANPAPAKPGTRRIWLQSADGLDRFQRTMAEIKDDGEFSIANVTPGDWRLNYEPLAPGTYIKSVRFGDQDVSPGRFTIEPGGAGSLKIVIGANPGEVDGTVQLDNPQPPGNITVLLLPDIAGTPLSRPNQQTTVNAQMISDAGGRFSFQNIAPGRYRLCAFEQGSPGFQFDDLLKSLGEEVTVEEGQHITKQIKLVPAAAIADALKEVE
jgi:hypothetical protein